MCSLHTEQFHLEAECKVHSQKGGCREANTLMDLRNYYVMDMDRGEHSRSQIGTRPEQEGTVPAKPGRLATMQ